jgi:hypothetical protein
MTVAGFWPMMIASDWHGNPSQTNERTVLAIGPNYFFEPGAKFIHKRSPCPMPLAAQILHD